MASREVRGSRDRVNFGVREIRKENKSRLEKLLCMVRMLLGVEDNPMSMSTTF